MKSCQVVFRPPCKVTVEEMEIPKPGPGEMLVKNSRSAISTGTELTMLMKEFPEGSKWDQLSRTWGGSGYSSVGEVIELGPGVEGFARGDRVTCGSNHCHFARQKASHRIVKVPDKVPDEVACMYRLAEITMNGVRRGLPQWGECAVVYGLGIIGQFTAIFARLAGCRPVIGVDISALRRELALKLGIDLAIDGNATDILDQVRAANHGRPADLVYEVTGVGELIPEEMDLLRKQGRIVIVSSPRSKTTIDLHDYCNSPSLSIIGAHNSSHPEVATAYNPFSTERDIELFFDHVVGGEIDPSLLITHRFPWWESPAAYELLMERRGEAGAVILDWSAENSGIT